ncbi:peptidoglycan DD-metalloendopeptidase family protein [Hydrogenoanaerobacterium sp.]|uniref:peptidoglycan DD-metalloendopeptidase family protein n=1 Tax=Hydrogenoanaerobacterium sp. TaxID=2953763 RepID=UPI0028963AFE|nr:peptidoglycan DD-metalloendopeptidase family protein [Hydrogenoanaerobacterium sp.]
MAQKLVLPIDKSVFSAGYKSPAYLKQQGYNHYGVDLFSDGDGLTVYACGNGTVIAAGMDGNALNQRLGNCIVIVYQDVELHSGKVVDLACRMFHFSSIGVKAGDKVTKDTVIGMYGNTGGTLVNGKPMGYHLHIEFDTDAKYPQYAVGISSSGRVILKGTVDSTINPSDVWYLDKNQSIWGKDVGWYTNNDIELPTVYDESNSAESERCKELQARLTAETKRADKAEQERDAYKVKCERAAEVLTAK